MAIPDLELKSAAEAATMNDASEQIGFGNRHFQFDPGPLTVRYASRKCGDIHLAWGRSDKSFEMIGLPSHDTVWIFMQTESSRSFTGRASNIESLVSRTDVIVPGEELNIFVRTGVDVWAAAIPDSELLAATRALLSGDTAESRGRRPTMSCQAPVRDSIHSAIIAGLMLNDTHQNSQHDLSTRLIDTAAKQLAIFDHDRREGRSSSFDSDLDFVRRYIDSHMDDDISTSDLCGVLGISIRHVQRLFRAGLGMSPTRYLQIRRLNNARRDLLGGRTKDARVATAAFDAGFTHLGRFAAEYREFFGERPSDTLHRTEID